MCVYQISSNLFFKLAFGTSVLQIGEFMFVQVCVEGWSYGTRCFKAAIGILWTLCNCRIFFGAYIGLDVSKPQLQCLYSDYFAAFSRTFFSIFL